MSVKSEGSRRDVDDIAQAFAACVVDEDRDVSLVHALAWAQDVWSSGVDEVPLVLVHDLGFVLWRGRSVRLGVGVADADDADRVDVDDARAALRAARLAYLDRVVAPWLADESVLAAHVVLAGLSDRARARAIPHAIAQALGRVLPPGRFRAHNAATLRTLRARRDADALGVDVDAALDAVHADGDAIRAAADVIDAARDVLAGRPLFRPFDLWELEHLEEVPSEAARLALRTVHQLVDDLGPLAPSVRAALHRNRHDVPVDDDDDGAFPAGGFDAMSTKGTFENLVRSEVSYVGEGRSVDGDGRASGPDLFDLRFVEGELLYYTRDETPLLEQKRRLVFVVDEAERLRQKFPELVTQTLVLVLALALRAQRDVVTALGPLASETTIALGGDPAVVDEELGVLSRSLRAELALGRAHLCHLSELPTGGTRVVFSARPAPSSTSSSLSKKKKATSTSAAEQLAGFSLWIRCAGPRFVVSDAANDKGKNNDVDVVDVVDAADLSALRALVDRILLRA